MGGLQYLHRYCTKVLPSHGALASHNFLLLLRARETGLADLHVTAPHRSPTAGDELFSVHISHADSSSVPLCGREVTSGHPYQARLATLPKKQELLLPNNPREQGERNLAHPVTLEREGTGQT